MPTKFFGTVRPQFWLKTVICALLSINFSIPENFRKTEGFLYKTLSFGPVRQKVSTKPWCPPSYAWKFSIEEFFWNTKMFSNEIFRYSETKKFSTEFSDIRFLCIKFCDTRNSLKHQSLPQRNFSIFRYCVTKSFWRRRWYPPPLSDA